MCRRGWRNPKILNLVYRSNQSITRPDPTDPGGKTKGAAKLADEPRVPQLPADMSQSLMLLRASHDLYQSFLDALRQNNDELGDPDLPGLFRQMNEALTGFAPRDMEIRRLLSRFDVAPD